MPTASTPPPNGSIASTPARISGSGSAICRSPVSPRSVPCPVRPDGHILLVGGYAEVFPGAPREHPGFATDTWIFNPVARTWSAGPEMPRAPAGDRDRSTDAGPGPVVAAPGAVWQGHAVVISGEIRPATRTPAVLAWPLR
jgi:hypothetical protein